MKMHQELYQLQRRKTSENSIDLELPISVNVTEELNSKLDSIIGHSNIIIT